MGKEPPPRISIAEIFTTFLLIGATGFGGGMAVVSLAERVCVHKKKWLGHEEFMHGLAFGQVLGPFSLNIATFVGCHLRGPLGGIAAAVGFITPSFCLVTLLSWLYFTFHKLPQLQSALKATNPVIIGLILVAAVGMARKSVTGRTGWAMALLAFVASGIFDVSALIILPLAVGWSFIRSYVKQEHA